MKPWQIFLLDTLLFQWLTLPMTFWFFWGKHSDNPENVDWASSALNHAREAPKAKLLMKDQSRERYEVLWEKELVYEKNLLTE